MVSIQESYSNCILAISGSPHTAECISAVLNSEELCKGKACAECARYPTTAPRHSYLKSLQVFYGDVRR